MKHQRVLAVGLILLSFIVLAACQPSGGLVLPAQESEAVMPEMGAEGVEGKKTLVYVANLPVKNLDSTNPQGYPTGYEAVFLIYDNLVTYDANLNIIPGLAESWEVSDDQLRWTFHLRQGVKFHDGTPFNAAAVKAHVDRLHDPNSKVSNRSLWAHISDVETPDEYTVVLVTEAPFGAMLRYLAHGSGGINSPAALERWGEDEYGLHPVGTGPYKVESFTPGVELVLTRNENYWGERPPLDRIIFRAALEPGARVAMLQAGDADVINDVPPEEVTRLQAEPEVEIVRSQGLRTFFIMFNLLNPIFQDLKVRQALNYAVDKESIVENLFLGYATVLDSPAASAIPGHVSAGYYAYDPDRARQLLAEAGWIDTDGDGILEKNGRRLEFHLNTSEGEYPKDIQVAEAVQAMLREVGASVIIDKVEAAGRWDLLRVPDAEARYDTVLFGFNPSNGDLGYHLDALFRSNEDPTAPPRVWNLMRYRNPKVDELILQGAKMVDEEVRDAAYAEAQKQIMEDAPVIFLYAPDLLVGIRSYVEKVTVWPTIFTILREANIR